MAWIHAAAFPPGEIWDKAAFAAQLALPGVFGFVCERGGFILARVTVDEAEILTLAVVPEQRRQGAAHSLLAEAEQAAWARGATSIFLEVADANTAARCLYAKRGYAPVGVRRSYYKNGGDAIILRRDRECRLQAASERTA